MAGRGGKRAGAGRPPNSRNKTTAELRNAAQKYSTDCLEILMKIARNSDSDAARVSAVKEILDRAHGKATAIVENTGPDGAPLLPPTILFQSTNEKAPGAE